MDMNITYFRFKISLAAILNIYDFVCRYIVVNNQCFFICNN